MNVAHFITAIEEHGVTFRVERRRASLTGRIQFMILISYPSFEVEGLVFEDVELLRAHRTEVRKFLLDREAPEIERTRRQSPFLRAPDRDVVRRSGDPHTGSPRIFPLRNGLNRSSQNFFRMGKFRSWSPCAPARDRFTRINSTRG